MLTSSVDHAAEQHCTKDVTQTLMGLDRRVTFYKGSAAFLQLYMMMHITIATTPTCVNQCKYQECWHHLGFLVAILRGPADQAHQD